MLDIGFWEMGLISAIALVVLGPERLPEAARTVGKFVGKARRMLTDVKADIKSEMSLDELDELRALRDDLKGHSIAMKQQVSSFGDELKSGVVSVDARITDVKDSIEMSVEPASDTTVTPIVGTTKP